MKKLIAIVLVLTLAFAGSALAITDESVSSTVTDGFIPVSLGVLQNGPSVATGSFFGTLGGIVSNYAPVEGQLVYFNFRADLSQVAKARQDATGNPVMVQLTGTGNPSLKVSTVGVDVSYTSVAVYGTNLYGSTITYAPYTTLSSLGVNGFETPSTITYAAITKLGTNEEATVANFVFFGIVRSVTEASVTGTLSVGGGSIATTTPGTNILNNTGSDEYFILKNPATGSKPAGAGNGYLIQDASATPIPLMYIELNSNGTVKNLSAYLDTTVTGSLTVTAAGWFNVYKNYGSADWMVSGVNAGQVFGNFGTAGNIASLNSVLNSIFSFFGFDYYKNGVVKDDSFIGRGNKYAYTADLVLAVVDTDVLDPDDTGDDTDIEEPPITADTASTFGFVMIGVAMIAAASLAVVAKKSR